VSANQKYFKLNEHGPALNVFWTCQSELGAQVNRKKDPDKDEEAFKDKKRKNQKSFSGPALEPDG
jgi:hypothetical protein